MSGCARARAPVYAYIIAARAACRYVDGIDTLGFSKFIRHSKQWLYAAFLTFEFENAFAGTPRSSINMIISVKKSLFHVPRRDQNFTSFSRFKYSYYRSFIMCLIYVHPARYYIISFTRSRVLCTLLLPNKYHNSAHF